MIQKLIFDYGGVFTKGSRAKYVAKALAPTPEQQEEIRQFLGSEFIKQAAEGKWTTPQVLERLQDMLDDADTDKISRVLAQACKPDAQMLHLLHSLKARYPVFLISDSLPPYSEYINEKFAHVFDGLFLSDRLGERKSGQLYDRAEGLHPGLFTRSVYIDDRAANLPGAVSRGAVGLLFKSPEALVEDLLLLGVSIDSSCVKPHGTI